MKVLMLSCDASIVREGEPAYERRREYEKLFDELHVVVVTSILSLARSFFAASRIIKKDPRRFIVTSQEEFTGLVAFLLKLRFGIPWQAQIHTDIFSSHYKKVFFKNRLRALVARLTLPYASCVRVVSVRIRQSLEAHGIKAPIVVLPIYTDLARFRNITRQSANAHFRIVMISRLTREKNIDLALRAFAKLKENAKLVIVGDGPERARLEKEAPANARFVPWQKDIAPYLAEADCFLSTSLYEGYGLAAVEAMASGLAVITSNVGIAGGMLKDGISGLVFEPDDEDGLLVCLKKVQANPMLRKELAEGAKKAVEALPSKEEYLNQFKKSFEICRN